MLQLNLTVQNELSLNSRNLGLDIARSLAILMVLIGHAFYSFLPFNHIALAVYELISRLGVEIFFVLSGFLIGQILIRDVLSNNQWSLIPKFYIRRWFRTLPLYYLVFLFLLITRPANGYVVRDYIFFLQGINQESLNYYGVTWSLAIEEWFYLITPPLLLSFLYFWKINRTAGFFTFCYLVIFLSLLARLAYVLLIDTSKSELIIGDFTFLRLDSLIVGVMLAGLKMYKTKLYLKLSQKKQVIRYCLIVGILALGCEQMFLPSNFKNEFFDKTIFLSIIPFYFTFLILYLDTSKYINLFFVKYKFSVIFKFISLTSYSSYLIHLLVYGAFTYLATNYFPDLINLETGNLIPKIFIGAIFSFVAIFVTILISSLIYYHFELPVMQLRDKFVTNKIDSDKTI